MAEQQQPPINNIPFAEGAPPDDLQVEKLNDNEVLVGDPQLDSAPEQVESQFDENLAETIDQRILDRIASELLTCYKNDKYIRS